MGCLREPYGGGLESEALRPNDCPVSKEVFFNPRLTSSFFLFLSVYLHSSVYVNLRPRENVVEYGVVILKLRLTGLKQS